MNNIAWLEILSTKTDYEIENSEILKKQTSEIQKAYQSNDQTTLRILLGGTDKLACRNKIFQF